MVAYVEQAPDITNELPSVLSARTAARTFENTNIQFTLAIADLPFMQAPTKEQPETRDTADWRRQQFDNSREAGEQSLDQEEWIRSEASFHGGAGIKFYDPGVDESTEFRYASSQGLDVWTKGQVTLLHDMTKYATSAGVAEVCSAVVAGADLFFINLNGVINRSDGTTSTAYSGLSAALGVPVVGGGSVIVGANAQLWYGPMTGGSPAMTSFGLTGATGTLTPYWVKSRLIVTNANRIYSFALPTAGAIPAALYTHPDTNWTWTAVTEAPDSILAAGYSNGYSAVYRFGLIEAGSGATPTLSSAFQVAELPPGEIITSMKAYLGIYVALGTSLGIRIGQLTNSVTGATALQYGPLLLTTDNPVRALAARDRFVYAAIHNGLDGHTGVLRVDLQAEIPNTKLRFPYAFDVSTKDFGQSNSLCFLGDSDRVVQAIQTDGVYLQSATAYVTSGYLYTGNIRYATVENKAFRSARIRATLPTDTGISLSTVSPAGSEVFIIRQTGASNSNEDIALRQSAQVEYLSFKLLVDSGAAHTATPTLTAFQVKAIPAPRKQRLISYQILLTDDMADANGAPLGSAGYAAKALLALEDLESTFAVVLVQDKDMGESYQGTIYKIHSERYVPRTKADPNWGARVTVTVRKL